MNDLQTKIKERAFALYLERGSKPGHAMDDWKRAEEEIMGKQKASDQATAKPPTKNAKEPQPQTSQKSNGVEMKKTGKPLDATVFSSNKHGVRSAMKE
jgi:hypothetical protein